MHEVWERIHHPSYNSIIPLSVFWICMSKTQSCLQGSWRVWRARISINCVKLAAIGGISSMYTNTWKEGAKRMEPGSFQWCPVTGQEAMGTHRHTGDSLWTLFYCEHHWALAQVAQRGCGVSLLGDIQKPSGHGPGQLALGGPAWAGVLLDQMTSRGPSQPPPLCNRAVDCIPSVPSHQALKNLAHCQAPSPSQGGEGESLITYLQAA